MNALVQGNSSLTHAGTGTLILDQANTATGALGITNAGAVVQLGTEAKAGQWAGTVLNGEGTLKIVNGALTSAMTRAEGATAAIVVDSASSVNLGKLTAACSRALRWLPEAGLSTFPEILRWGREPRKH